MLVTRRGLKVNERKEVTTVSNIKSQLLSCLSKFHS